MHCGKESSCSTILDFVELLPFIFYFRDSSNINTDPMENISPVCPF